MLFYILLLIILTLLGYVICYKTKLRFKNEIYMGLVFCVLTFISSIRYEVGYDYSYTYVPCWRQFLNTPISNWGSLYHEKGYVLLEYFISLVTKNFQAVFICTSIILGALSMFYLYKYASDKVLSVFIYFSIGLYYCTMNFIRQSIAAFIFAFAVIFLKKKKIIPYMLLVLLASTFHKSALLMIPFYFILQIKITKKVLALYSIVTATILLTSERIMEFVMNTGYYNYSLDSTYIADGIELYNIVVPVIFFILMFIFQDTLCKKDAQNKIYVSCSFFSMFFYLVALNHSIVDRFTLYFDLTMIVGLTYLVTELREQKNKEDISTKIKNRIKKRYITVITLIIVCVSLTNLIQLCYDGHFVTPYKTIFGSEDYKLYVNSLNQEGTILNEEPIDSGLDDFLLDIR